MVKTKEQRQRQLRESQRRCRERKRLGVPQKGPAKSCVIRNREYTARRSWSPNERREETRVIHEANLVLLGDSFTHFLDTHSYNPKIKIEVNTLDEIDESFDPDNEEDKKKMFGEPMETGKEKFSTADEDENFISEHGFYGGEDLDAEDPLSFDIDTTDKTCSLKSPKTQTTSNDDSPTFAPISSKPAITYRKRRKTIEPENKENRSKGDEEEVVDEDKEFLLSLLPIMKELNSSQKSEFKSSVLKELNRIKYPKPSPNTNVTKTLNMTTLTSGAPTGSPPLNTLITVLPYGFPIQNTIRTNVKQTTPEQQTNLLVDKSAPGTNKSFIPQQTNLIKLPVGGPLNLINIPKSMLSSALQKTTVTSGNIAPTLILNTTHTKNLAANVSEISGLSPSQAATVESRRNVSLVNTPTQRSANLSSGSSLERSNKEDGSPTEQSLRQNSDDEQEQLIPDITVEEIKIEPLDDIKQEPLDDYVDRDDFNV